MPGGVRHAHTPTMTRNEILDDRPGTMTEPTWAPPGPGSWQRETTHAPGPITPIFQEVISAGAAAGTGQMAARYGLPIAHVDFSFVNDHIFMRAIPLIGPKPRKPPPPAVLRAISRVHPRLRPRAKQADAAVAGALWREDARRWYEEQKPALVADNLALQDEDLAGLDDVGLADHVDRTVAHAISAYTIHFALHGPDQIPVGDFLMACAAWGITQEDALSVLRGASPASRGDTEALAPIADAVAAAAVRPTGLDEIRALGSSAAAALDAYLRLHAWRAASSLDIASATEGELPELLLAAVLAMVDSSSAAGDARPGADALADVRAMVPEADRQQFDLLAADARLAWGLRDDHVSIDNAWSSGLIRRALLEVGARLARRALVEKSDHAFELARAEVLPALQESGPGRAELSRHAAERERLSRVAAPYYLGEEPPPPSPSSFPPAMARMTSAFLTCLAQWWNPPSRDALHGTGIGTSAYRGIARVALAAEDAVARVQQGDVLVARFTTPAYNPALAAVGAIVVEEGGALCHAAIMAREFGVPAVVGALGATSAVADGELVEVDPLAGTIRSVYPAAARP